MKTNGILTFLSLMGLTITLIFVSCSMSKSTKLSLNQYANQEFEKHTNLSGAVLYSLYTANENIRSGKCTEADMHLLESSSGSNSSAVEFRVTSVMALAHLKGTPYEARANKILYRLVCYTDPGTRLIAIRSLFKMNDPNALTYLAIILKSDDEFTKKEANKILTEQRNKK